MQITDKKKSKKQDDQQTIATLECSQSKQNQQERQSVGALEKFIKRQKTVDLLKKKGIEYLFPIQSETYNLVYNKFDMIAKDRTGSGKTLAYSLPIIERFRDRHQFADHLIKFLIVLPTRELANQVRSQITSLRFSTQEFNAVSVYGGSPFAEQISEIRRGADIIVCTPGRLLDLLEKGIVNLGKLQVVCLDEADQMLRQGFQEDIEKIFGFIKKQNNKKIQHLLFSATIPSWVLKLSETYLHKDYKFIDMIKDSAIKTSKTIQHLAIQFHSKTDKEKVLGQVIDYYAGKDGRIIVFTETKRQANEIGSRAKIRQTYEVLHGDIPQKKREYIYKQFKQGNIKCIIATNVAARGLDIPEVDLVLQLEPPKDAETYIHRAGRTGRAGKSGVCLTFYTDIEKRLIEKIESFAEISLKCVKVPKKSKERQQKVKSSFSYSHSVLYEACENQQQLIMTQKQYVKCTLRLHNDFISMSPVFEFLQQFLTPKTYLQVKNMKRSGSNSASFEIPVYKTQEVLKIAWLLKEKPSQKYQVLVVDNSSLKAPPQPQISKVQRSTLEPLSQATIRQAQRRRKQLQIFVGGLSYSLTEKDLTDFFRNKRIQIVKLNILRDQRGQSKGIAFVLCADDKNFKQALKLNGQTLHHRTLRINAGKRQ